MPFSATADGNVSAGTCSLTEDCQAGPNSAMPLPTTKQNVSRICGVTRPSHASTDSAVEPTSEIDSEISATTRRSYMSAMAPAGIEISMIGSIRAVWTSATLSADDVICVIAQAAPTPWINRPRLESRLASQMRRNTRMPQRGRDAVGGKHRAFRLFSHCPFRLRRPWPAVDSLRFAVMPAKVLGCPVVRPLSAVTQGG